MFHRRRHHPTHSVLRVALVLTLLAASAIWLTGTLAVPAADAAPAFPVDAELPACTTVPVRPAGTMLDSLYTVQVWHRALTERGCLDRGYVRMFATADGNNVQDQYYADQVSVSASQTTFNGTDAVVPISLSLANIGPYSITIPNPNLGPAEAYPYWTADTASDYPDGVRYRYRRVDGTWEPTWRSSFPPVQLKRTGTDCMAQVGSTVTVGGHDARVGYADGSPRKSTCAYDVVIRQNAIPGYVDPDGVNLERDLQVVVGVDWHWVQAQNQGGSWISFPHERSAAAALNLFIKGTSAPPPTVGITYSASGTAGTFDFSANAAAADPATIERYDWDFGDGDVRLDASSLESKAWVGEAATRTVSVKVTDSRGKTATDTATLTPKLSIDSAPTDPNPLEVGDAAAILLKVRNDGPSTITGVTPEVGLSPITLVALSGSPVPATADLAPGEVQTFRVPIDPLEEGEVTGTVGAHGASAGGTVSAATEPLTFTIGNPGIKLELEADQAARQHDDFNVKLTITNPGADAITGIEWGDPTGLALKTDDGPVPVVRTLGPDPALPTSLASHEVVAVTYRFSAPARGGVVMTAEAVGKGPGDAAVSGKGAISVAVSFGLPNANQIRAAMVGLIDQTLATLGDKLRQGEEQLAAFVAQQLALLPPSPARQQVADHLGIPGALMGVLESGANAIGTIEDSYDAIMLGVMDGFLTKAGQTYKAGATLVSIAKDPIQRNALANAIWDSASQLPEASLSNLGYLGQSAMSLVTVEGWKNVGSSNAAFLSSTAEATQQIVSGELTLLGNAAGLATHKPFEFLFATGQGIGSLGETAAEAWATGLVGKGIGTGVKSLMNLPSMTKKLIATSMTSADEAITAGLATKTVTPSLEAAEAFSQRANQAMDTVQALVYDTKVTAAEVMRLGGIPAADQRVLAEILAEGEQKFGVAVAYETRTSEPLSAGLDILAKPEFVKPKATSALDMLLGAEEANAGRVGLYKPTMPADQLIRAAEARNPGFTAALTDRYNAQLKLWRQWNDAGSPLRQIVAGSGSGPVTVIMDVPGRQKPFGIVFLEQLDDEAWVASKGLSPQQVADTRLLLRGKDLGGGQFSNAWPRTFRAQLEAQAAKDGSSTTTLFDRVSRKYLGSDLDGQGLAPVSGRWAMGQQGAYETWFQQQLATRLPRFPHHGHSNSAYDLQSKYFQVAAEFTLNTTRPEAAEAMAQNLARKIVTTNARLAGEELSAEELQARVTAKATELMTGYKPEKTLLFINGDVLVSGGGFPK
jgi:hypothetical protein